MLGLWRLTAESAKRAMQHKLRRDQAIAVPARVPEPGPSYPASRVRGDDGQSRSIAPARLLAELLTHLFVELDAEAEAGAIKPPSGAMDSGRWGMRHGHSLLETS
jgi:hypothetical protein